MFDRKSAKQRAKVTLKKHYVVFVVACLLAAIIGADYTSTLASAETKTTEANIVENLAENGSTSIGMITADEVLSSLLEGDEERAVKVSDAISQTQNEVKIGALSLGAGKGILSGVINKIGSGGLLITIFQTIKSVSNSKSVATAIFIVLAALVYLSVTIFVTNTYKVAFRRIFLEGYNYDHVKTSRFLFLFRVNKFIHAAITIFVTSLFELLWDLTIVGGVIKHYSYYLVPYIIAENPGIKTLDAITLSRKMMDGHKWECFKLELSFIGWEILGAVTFGISQVFYSNPYQECTYVNYYVWLRQLAYDNKIENIELLNDEYLYKKASEEQIKELYSDVYEIMYDDIHLEDCKHTGIRGFFEDNFGVISKYDKDEDKFNTAIEQEVKINEFKHILALNAYPGRLFPIKEDEKNPRLENVHYLRHYSIWSIVALFFIFSFIGWSWEVLLHIVKDGVFVNRGVNHGPWLPIYGCGGALILLFLYRLRRKPAAHIVATIAVCGVVEYFTSWILELTKNTKWWDYSGYFLNLNGRICAEGLLVFALGGTAIVYALGPIIDNNLRKVNQKVLKVICIVLLVIFAVDVVYSNEHPNVGKGITDYGDNTAVVLVDERYNS